MNFNSIKTFLDQKVEQFNIPDFICSDPISIPHQFSSKEDIEISAFLTATIAWGKRSMIIANAKKMMLLLDNAPYDFIMNCKSSDLDKIEKTIHRTFNHIDFRFFILSLQNIYLNEGGLEGIFTRYQHPHSLQFAIHQLRNLFFCLPHEKRTEKHLPDPLKGSAAKRINMFLRWMIRNDNKGVDFGLWQNISPAQLSIPLDVHAATVARKIGLLSRQQNDAKAVAELDIKLRTMDSNDPVKYDFALFGLGVSGML